MSMKMSIDAYKELIDGNIRWLGNQPESCERSHITGIVQDSIRFYYPYHPTNDIEQQLKQSQLDLDQANKDIQVLAEALLGSAGCIEYHANNDEIQTAYIEADNYEDLANKHLKHKDK